ENRSKSVPRTFGIAARALRPWDNLEDEIFSRGTDDEAGRPAVDRNGVVAGIRRARADCDATGRARCGPRYRSARRTDTARGASDAHGDGLAPRTGHRARPVDRPGVA